MYSPVHILKKDAVPDVTTIDEHCHKRIRIMITMGVILRKIVDRKKFTDLTIDFDGAKIQDGKGKKTIGTEAAHNLPRNVLLNGRSTWDYIHDIECNFHERVRKQIYLLSASTVLVEREVSNNPPA
jgi:hypothetical protein